MKKILLISAIALVMSCSKQIKEKADNDSEANYIPLGQITTGFGLKAFKLTIDSVDYIVVSRLDGGTSIIRHGLTNPKHK